MKRRIISALLAGVLLCTGLFAAGAAEPVQLPESRLPAMPDAPVGEYAAVLDMQAKSGMYSDLIVRTDSQSKLVLHFTDETVLMDTQTGLPVQETDVKKGDKVYIYRDEGVDMSMPPQTGVRAVLVNLDEQHAPATLLTVEAVESRTEKGVTVLCGDGGLRLTISADAEITPFAAKNIVTSEDIRTGTRLFAWYDVVAESYPAQARTDKVVLLPQRDCTFAIVVEGDMMIWGGGRIENGVAMAPVRKVAEALGYTVQWNGALRRVTLKKAGTTAALIQLGQDKYAFGDGDGRPLGAIAYEVGGTSWAPAELFAALGEPVALQKGTLYVSTAAAQIVNPIEVVEDTTSFKTLGLPLAAPAGAQNVQYSIIGGQTAQVKFTLDKAAYTLRASKLEGDISGVYEEFEDEAVGLNVCGSEYSVSVEIRTMKNGGHVGTWTLGETQYSLTTYDKVGVNTMQSLILSLDEQEREAGLCGLPLAPEQ